MPWPLNLDEKEAVLAGYTLRTATYYTLAYAREFPQEPRSSGGMRLCQKHVFSPYCSSLNPTTPRGLHV